jgi:hypothetical protein
MVLCFSQNFDATNSGSILKMYRPSYKMAQMFHVFWNAITAIVSSLSGRVRSLLVQRLRRREQQRWRVSQVGCCVIAATPVGVYIGRRIWS